MPSSCDPDQRQALDRIVDRDREPGEHQADTRWL